MSIIEGRLSVLVLTVLFEKTKALLPVCNCVNKNTATITAVTSHLLETGTTNILEGKWSPMSKYMHKDLVNHLAALI